MANISAVFPHGLAPNGWAELRDDGLGPDHRVALGERPDAGHPVGTHPRWYPSDFSLEDADYLEQYQCLLIIEQYQSLDVWIFFWSNNDHYWTAIFQLLLLHHVYILEASNDNEYSISGVWTSMNVKEISKRPQLSWCTGQKENFDWWGYFVVEINLGQGLVAWLSCCLISLSNVSHMTRTIINT